MSDFTDAIQHNLPGLHVAPGDESTEFSFSECDSCGTRLGGARHAATAYVPATSDVLELEVCTDCLFFHANGEEPEQWP
tara:strand:+ start:212 stop:448 length:237 start_codon:yes stop_codon:yes gene_type:complete